MQRTSSSCWYVAYTNSMYNISLHFFKAPSWSGMETEQIVGRVHRPPQKKEVVAYHLLVNDSPEMFLSRIAQEKQYMHEAFVTSRAACTSFPFAVCTNSLTVVLIGTYSVQEQAKMIEDVIAEEPIDEDYVKLDGDPDETDVISTSISTARGRGRGGGKGRRAGTSRASSAASSSTRATSNTRGRGRGNAIERGSASVSRGSSEDSRPPVAAGRQASSVPLSATSSAMPASVDPTRGMTIQTNDNPDVPHERDEGPTDMDTSPPSSPTISYVELRTARLALSNGKRYRFLLL